MSNNLIYHIVTPENDRSGSTASDGFPEFSMIDFVMNFPDRKLVNNSIRLVGDVIVGSTMTNNTEFATNNVFTDNLVGASSFIDSIQTSVDSVGQIENILEYSKYVKCKNMVNTSPSDLFKASSICELKAPNQSHAKLALKGVNATKADDNRTDNANFSIKPDICLNSMFGDNGDNTLSYRKSGQIRISVRLARALGSVFGGSVPQPAKAGHTAFAVSYRLQNVRLHFQSIVDDGKDSRLTMPNVINVKSTIQSSFANINCAVPAVCRGVSATFIEQSKENHGLLNPLACNNLPGLSKVQFIYNNTINNSMVSYQITDYPEILERFKESIGSSNHSSATLLKTKSNDGFGVGLDFSGLIDLSRQRFNIQLNSSVSNLSPYTMNLFFHGVQSL
tara:strand:+ start:2835 stop:4010 length:1176 start_codon:yes stop_codon:yes gene_type:complete